MLQMQFSGVALLRPLHAPAVLPFNSRLILYWLALTRALIQALRASCGLCTILSRCHTASGLHCPGSIGHKNHDSIVYCQYTYLQAQVLKCGAMPEQLQNLYHLGDVCKPLTGLFGLRGRCMKVSAAAALFMHRSWNLWKISGKRCVLAYVICKNRNLQQLSL